MPTTIPMSCTTGASRSHTCSFTAKRLGWTPYLRSRYGTTIQYCGGYALPLDGPATHTAAGPTNMAYRPTTLYKIAQIISTRNYGHFHRNLSVPKLIFNAKGKTTQGIPRPHVGYRYPNNERRARSAQPALEC